jgi:hypothetical protein
VLDIFAVSGTIPCDWIDSFDSSVAASSSVSFQRVGKLVTVYIEPFFMSGTVADATSYLACSVNIPSSMTPASAVVTDVPIAINNNGVQSPTGVAHMVSTLGTINLWNNSTVGGFGAGAQLALAGTTLSWHTN